MYKYPAKHSPRQENFKLRANIVPFSTEHTEPAIKLLATRHEREQQQQPMLPKDFDAANAVKNAFEKPQSQGVAAYKNGEMIGYLLDHKIENSVMGRTAWLGLSGHAVAEQENLSIYADMYAALAEMWVCAGYFDHYVMVPAVRRDLLDTWFSLGFGMQQAYALLDLTQYTNTAPIPDNVIVRLAEPRDRDAVYKLGDTIAQYQMQAPVFAPVPPEVIDEIRSGIVELIDNPKWTLWIAEKNGEVVGYQGYVIDDHNPTNPIVPPNCVELSIGGTIASERGNGIGRALTVHGLQHVKNTGYSYCLTDWRTTNLLSSRFWYRFGFEPVAYRLTRHIDPRVIWTTQFKCS